MPAPPSTASRWQDHWPALGLSVLAAVVALWAHQHLFPHFSWNRDEPVYLWHADALRAGHLTPTDGGFPSLFHPWLSARGEGVLFTQYTLGWPLVLLVAEVITGSAASALLLGAALAVLGTYLLAQELIGDRRIALGGSALMLASPILAIQGGVYLGYLFTLGLGLVFATLLLSGVRLGRAPRLLGAGALLGLILLTRPFDAVLWGLGVGGFAAIRERTRLWRLVRSMLICGMGATPFLMLTLIYNRHVTGGWLSFPITAADPMDTFGFGRRRLMPTFEIVDYDFQTAARATAKNAFLLPWFLAGSYVGIALAALGLWQRRREASTGALLLIGAAFPVGYFFFWGTHLSSLAARISGPIYFVPLYPLICILIASSLVQSWHHSRRRTYVLLAALVAATIPGAVTRFDVNREISLQQEPWQSSINELTGPSLIFVADAGPYLLYLNPFSANGPDLDDRILYATDNGPSMLDLIAASPGRAVFMQQATVPSEDIGPRERPFDLDVQLTPVQVLSARAIDLTVTISRPPDAAREMLDVTTGVDRQRVRLDTNQALEPFTHIVRLVQTAAEDGLQVADRGMISITVGGSGPRERVDLVYRVVQDRIEVLLPVASYQWRAVGEESQRRRTLDLPGLRVAVAVR